MGRHVDNIDTLSTARLTRGKNSQWLLKIQNFLTLENFKLKIDVADFTFKNIDDV